MSRDETTYGFSLADANETIGLLGGRERVYPRGPHGWMPVAHFKTPSGGIAGRSGLQMNFASCDLYDCSDTGLLSDSGEDDDVYNPVSAAVAGNTHIVAAKNQAGLWVCIVEDCLDGGGGGGGGSGSFFGMF